MSVKTKIRPSIAGGLQGVDVEKIVASSVAEDKQDIEEAIVKAKRSAHGDELDIPKKPIEIQTTGSNETSSNSNKTVCYIHEQYVYLLIYNKFDAIILGEGNTVRNNNPRLGLTSRRVDQHFVGARTTSHLHRRSAERKHESRVYWSCR